MNEREIFQSVINIPDAQERQSYLDGVCGQDAMLRARIEKLLHAHQEASGFLETPAAEQLAGSTEEEANATVQLPHAHSQVDDAADPGGLEFLQPGTKPESLGRLAHYEVLETLGRGAFGIVLKAFDEKLHRMVAIKVMNPELAATSPPRKRFVREAQSSAKIRHENIVGIHDIQESPLPYLVMEYIPGGTLQERLDQKGPLEIADILRIGQQIAQGLAAAHAQGLIHRDIKPANILIESGIEERVKITDFGLARATDDASMTQSGLIAGTPMYMAPEQAKGQPLDHRTDLFSLGSVLYTMASGRPPFRAANTIAVLKRVCEDTPRPIREVIPETPSWLCDIISKLHAKDPDDRFASAKAVADVLGQHLAFIKEPMKIPRPEPIVLPPNPDLAVTPKVSRPAKSGWTPVGLLLAIIAGVLMIPVIGLVLLIIAIAVPAYQAAYSRIPALPPEPIRHGLRFDGKDDYVKVDGLDWSYPQFTLEAFVTSANDGDNGVIAMLYSGGEKPEAMYLFDGPASTQQRMSGAGVMGKKPFGNAMAPLSTGVRQHRALVFDGQVLNYYVNGVWQGKRYNEAKQGLQWQIDNLLIGCKSTETEFFRGVIDQVRVSRVARYTANFPPLTHISADETTLALYNFEEGSGDQLRDSSGHNHHARIYGATWINTSASTRPNEEWVTLFNGRDFTGWEKNDHWKIENGILISRVPANTAKSPAMLVTQRKDFRDFHARIEAKINSGGDSGFFFRFGEQGDKALQVQITAAPTGIGSVLRETTTLSKSLQTIPPNTWTTIEVLAHGPQISVAVNGSDVVRWTESAGEIPAGPLAFEAGFAGTEIAIRKVEVKRLPPFTAPSPAITPDLAIAPFDAAAAKAHQEAWAKHLGTDVETVNSVGATMILIPPGEFLMGAPDTDADADPQEKPQHRVRLTKPFAIGATEVTHRQFRQFVEATKYVTQAESDGQGAFEVNPRVRKPGYTWNSPELKPLNRDEFPVRCVSWEDARRFCEWLTQTEGRVYRLPTEAEWEFACRAGTTTRFSFGNDLSDTPSPPGSGGAALRPVAQLPANPFGLFDMHGSVNEICWDSGRTFTTEPVTDPLASLERHLPAVVRGGAVSSNPARLRSSNRYLTDARQFPEANFATLIKGFRIVAEFGPPAQAKVSMGTAVAPFDAAAAKAHQEAWAKHLEVPVEYTNALGMKFRLIPPGEFQMGSTPEEIQKLSRELEQAGANDFDQFVAKFSGPRHRVRITQPFYLGLHEVTVADYRRFVEDTKYLSTIDQLGVKRFHWTSSIAEPDSDRRAVIGVSWDDAEAFCRWLTTREHVAAGLPSEAQWEYACRAGTTTLWSCGDDPAQLSEHAVLGQPSFWPAHAVGTKRPNPFGLFDMHGNADEWCEDWHNANFYASSPVDDPVMLENPSDKNSGRVARGGTSHSAAWWTRSATRPWDFPATPNNPKGFRVVLAVDGVRAELAKSPPVSKATDEPATALQPVNDKRN